jgi:excisionase family DNA binding protein
MNASHLDLEGMLRRLHLPTVRRCYGDLAVRAEKEGMAFRDYLAILIAEEVAHRAQTRIERSVRAAHFPFLATIEDFDFTFQTSIKLSLLGKTHLAIAIAYRAIQNGGTALLEEASHIIDDLSLASTRGRLRKALARYIHPDVLVVDELGYLSYPPDAANVLFQVVNQRYLKKRSMVFTTNKPLPAWAGVLHDADLAEAIIDRVLARGRLIELSGQSYRTRHHANESTAADRSPGAARISGITRPEFPEPTLAAQEASRKPVDGHMRETLMALGHNVDAAWNDPAAPVELKKRLLRSVIKEIVCNVLETPRDIVLNVHWAGGVHSIVRVARPLPGGHRHRTDHKAVELIRELARVCPDKFIASILNRIGLKTGTGRTWTESYVHSHRRDRGIAPFDPNTPRDWLTMHEAATMLGVSDRVVRRLILEKKLPAAQIVTKAPWMIARRDLEAENVQVVARAIREGKRAPCADPGQQRLPFFTENSEL